MDKQCSWMVGDSRCTETAVVATVVHAYAFAGRKPKPDDFTRPCLLMSCAKHSIREEADVDSDT